MITRCGSKEIVFRSIDPGRSARLCSRVVAVACHPDGTVCRMSHESVCCAAVLSEDIGALSVAYGISR